jgi:hypothetical protein
LVNSGTITILANSSISMFAEAQLLNEPGGVIEIRGTGNAIMDSGTNPGLISNKGLIRKTTNASAASINGRFVTLDGTWESTSGLLQLYARPNSSHTNATFNTSGTGGIHTHYQFDKVTYAGSITVGGDTNGTVLYQGNVVVAPGGVTIQGTRVVTMFNCKIEGSPGGSVLTNLGSISGTFVRFSGADLTVLNQGKLYTTTSNYIVELTQNAHLVNDVSGVIDLGGDAGFVNGGSTAKLTNRGLIRKSGGAGNSQIQSPIVTANEGGVIDVQSGTLTVGGGTVTQGGGVLGKGTLAGGLTNRGGFLRPNPVGGALTISGGYTQTADSLFVPEINGTATTSFSRAAVVGHVSLGGLITPVVNYAATVGDNFVVLTNDGTDAITGGFANAAEGGSITVNGVTFSVTYKGGDGNDVALTVTDVAAPSTNPPRVSLVAPNGGGAQRSRVTGLFVQFDQPVTQSGSLASAFQLSRQSDNAAVTLTGFDTGFWNNQFKSFGIPGIQPNFAYLTFAGGPVESGSLADGRYTLTINATQIGSAFGQLDGNGDGVGGDDYTLVGNPAAGPRLFRLFGDIDGNGSVSVSDFLSFRVAFLTANDAFDFNGSGSVDAGDFLAFRVRFLVTI